MRISWILGLPVTMAVTLAFAFCLGAVLFYERDKRRAGDSLSSSYWGSLWFLAILSGLDLLVFVLVTPFNVSIDTEPEFALLLWIVSVVVLSALSIFASFEWEKWDERRRKQE